jgi:hypothetical protein
LPEKEKLQLKHVEFCSERSDRSLDAKQGCQIFLGKTIPKRVKNVPKLWKIHQTVVTYAKWPENWPNGRTTCQHLPLQGPPKFTQIGIFGLEITIWQPRCEAKSQ